MRERKSRFLWLGRDFTERFRAHKGSLEEQQQKKSGAGSTHTWPHICLILFTVLVHDSLFSLMLENWNSQTCFLLTPRPCTATRMSALLHIHTKLASMVIVQILLPSTSISSPLCPFDVKQSISWRFVRGNYIWSCPSISREMEKKKKDIWLCEAPGY